MGKKGKAASSFGILVKASVVAVRAANLKNLRNNRVLHPRKQRSKTLGKSYFYVLDFGESKSLATIESCIQGNNGAKPLGKSYFYVWDFGESKSLATIESCIQGNNGAKLLGKSYLYVWDFGESKSLATISPASKETTEQTPRQKLLLRLGFW
ncbi:hypothetical protein BDZ91DRAFT_756745 [Kalaharituber pfeilii]|nr:hypothetical protein BDZ91DRAFT_756745 [Kalaharituber pfeilii]